MNLLCAKPSIKLAYAANDEVDAITLLAYMLLGEAITPIQIVGTFFVLTGVYIVSRGNS